MALSDLFGGSEERSLLTPQQNKFMRKIFNSVNPTIGKEVPGYGGETIAGINPMMQGAMASFPGTANLTPGVEAALAAQLSGAGDPAGVRSIYESALAPAKVNFMDTLNEVGSRYGDVWGRSGAHPMMAGRATADFGMGLNNLLANLVYQDRQAGMDRQAAAIPMATGLRDSNMNAMAQVYNMGTAQRGITQQKLTGDYNAWNAKQWYNNPAIPIGQSMMGIQAKGYVNEPGVFNQALQAGQGLANFGLALMKPSI